MSRIFTNDLKSDTLEMDFVLFVPIRDIRGGKDFSLSGFDVSKLPLARSKNRFTFPSLTPFIHR
jgi:hypothetical protein